jgi:hypothetical protein
MAKKQVNIIGSWAFLIGVLLSIMLGIVGTVSSIQIGSTWTIFLVIIGLIIGLLNVTGEETDSFLMAGLVLIISGFFGQSVVSPVEVLSRTLIHLLTIFVPAVIIVSIKKVFSIAYD